MMDHGEPLAPSGILSTSPPVDIFCAGGHGGRGGQGHILCDVPRRAAGAVHDAAGHQRAAVLPVPVRGGEGGVLLTRAPTGEQLPQRCWDAVTRVVHGSACFGDFVSARGAAGRLQVWVVGEGWPRWAAEVPMGVPRLLGGLQHSMAVGMKRVVQVVWRCTLGLRCDWYLRPARGVMAWGFGGVGFARRLPSGARACEEPGSGGTRMMTIRARPHLRALSAALPS